MTILFRSLLCLFHSQFELYSFFPSFKVSTISFCILSLFSFLETSELGLVWWTALSSLHQIVLHSKPCCWALWIRMWFTKDDKSLCSDSYFHMLLPFNPIWEHMDPNEKTGGFLLLSEWMEGLPSITKHAIELEL